MKVSISGHRGISRHDVEIISAKMYGYVLSRDVEEIFFGGAIGVDTEALRLALYWRTNGEFPRLTAIVPDKIWTQPANAQAVLRSLRFPDRVIELGNSITKTDGYAAYHIRNQELVNRIKDCGQLTAFWSGDKKGGTWSAIQYAKKVGAAWEHVQITGEKRR